MTDDLPDVWRLSLKFRADLRAGNDAAIKDLTRAYTKIYQRLAERLRLLQADIMERQAAGKAISPDWLRRQDRYVDLLRQVDVEVRKYGGYLNVKVDGLVEDAVSRANRDALALAQAGLPALPGPVLSAAWNTLPTEALLSAQGFMGAAGSPVVERLEQYGANTAARVSEELLASIAAGDSPRALAGRFRKALGMELSSALRWARTTQVMSYREATSRIYEANADIVPSWTWVSALDPAGTCLGCVGMHGTVHPVSERLRDHWNGWCVQAGNVVSYRDLGLRVPGPPQAKVQTGETAMRAMPRARVRALFGGDEDLFQKWLRKELTAKDFAHFRDDDVWGSMVGPKPKKELLGE